MLAGGFNGEIVLASVTGEYKWGMRVRNSDNCITNGLELTQGNSGAHLLIAANNDERVRVLDVDTQQTVCSFDLEWASNGACMCPTRRCDTYTAENNPENPQGRHSTHCTCHNLIEMDSALFNCLNV
jgi:hypothetical protein